ncbi:hypothetical protein STAFG_0412 [Streptomyces afghaniensis 772]|uniref:Uncharacterized protein n=1 Tax=Streptomyces afghaniensis 772 TaxID=1283301 RepID=S4MZ67_9ACTN|nr:hypothetical protein STAFG_0412 [Streptomyces afghaniensis 772]
MTIRTEYRTTTLDLVPDERRTPGLPPPGPPTCPTDAEQRTCRAFGLLMIEKPGIPGLLHVAWPFIRRFTERVFAEDRMAVEAEQRAWDEQGEDRNHEVFPLILDVREVLRANGVPIRARAAACGGASLCDGAQLPDGVRGQE